MPRDEHQRGQDANYQRRPPDQRPRAISLPNVCECMPRDALHGRRARGRLSWTVARAGRLRAGPMRILLCPLSNPGYLYPALAVGRELRRRGHVVEVLGGPKAEHPAAAAGISLLAAVELVDRGPEAVTVAARVFDVSHWFRQGAAQYHAITRAIRLLRPDVLLTSVLCHGALLAGEVSDL